MSVERHADHFADDAQDEEWLPEIGRRGWLALTHNLRIRYKGNERDAVMQAGLGLFVIVGKAPHRELAENFINTIGRILAFLERNHPPFIAKVYRPSRKELESRPAYPGRVELWLSQEKWEGQQPR